VRGVIFGDLGWSDQVDRIKRKMARANHPSTRQGPEGHTEFPGYVDQDGNDILICRKCRFWRAEYGDLCDMCDREEYRT